MPEHEIKRVKIYPPDYADRESRPRWTLKHPILVLYDEIPVDKDPFMRIAFPFSGIRNSTGSISPGDIVAGGGSTKTADHTLTATERLIALMGSYYEHCLSMKTDRDCPLNIRIMGKKLRRILSLTPQD